jgi:microcystin-dependent protein
MGSSLVLTGGAATTKTLKESISLTGHGFSVGTVIRYNPSGTPKLYVPAQADSAENAEVLGIVNAVTDANTFELTYGGYLEMPAFSGISFPVMFLSGVCAGGLTSNPPSALGQVIKPVATKHPTLNGFVLNNYLGTQIGGSSTVGIDQVQPVGSIMPFAGSAIPDSWLECNGTTYTVADYPELYGAIQYTTGDRMPLYGYVAKITSGAGNWTNIAAVGGYIQFKNNTTSTWTTNQPVSGQNLIYDTQAEITAQIIAVSGADVWVQVLPVYNSSTKTFVYPNMAFTTGGVLWNNTGAFTTSKYRVLDSTGTIIHTNNSVSAVSLVAFNTPDMRGRFAVGVNTSALGEMEADTANTSAISGIYALGSEGGEEKHILTTAEMPNHSHEGTISAPSNNPYLIIPPVIAGSKNTGINTIYASELDQQAGPESINLNASRVYFEFVGSNTPHNNMPPYLAVRYIIKAKPYTRAAIIDGLDLPWQSTLVRDLRTRAIGGSNSDLVFYTNTAGDSGLGTERMRIYGNGNTGDILFSGAGDSTTTNPLILSVGGTRINSNRDDAFFISTKQDGTTVGYFGFNGFSTQSLKYTEWEVATRGASDSASVTRLYINQIGNVGIGTQTPAVKLDVVGNIKASSGLVLGGATFAAPSGSAPIFAVRAWGKITPNGSSNPSSFVGGNIASAVRSGDGTITVTMTTAMPSTDYSVVASSVGQTVDGVDNRTQVSVSIISTTQFAIILAQSNTAILRDFNAANIITFVVVG